MITRETTDNPAPANDPANSGTDTDAIYCWALAQPLDNFIAYYKASPALQEKLKDPEFWRLLFVQHYTLLPPGNAEPKQALLSEYYYRRACEVYRQSRSHFFLMSSEAKVLLEDALTINPTHLSAAELLFFLYRDFCIQTLAPAYYPGLLEIGMVQVNKLAKHIEHWFPLVGTWRMACFYRALTPYVAALGGDYSERIQRKLAEATTIFFHETSTLIYPCDDKIDAVLAQPTGGFIYPQMGKDIVQDKLIKNNIYQQAVHNYYSRCVGLFSILQGIEDGVIKISSDAIAVQVRAACTGIRYAINNFSQSRKNPEAIFTNISSALKVLDETFFAAYPRQATTSVSHLVEQLNTFSPADSHFRGVVRCYLELHNPNLPPTQFVALTGDTRTSATSALTAGSSTTTVSSQVPVMPLTASDSRTYTWISAPLTASTGATSAQTPVMPFTASATATSARTQVAPVTASSSATSARTPIMPFSASATATSAPTQVEPLTASSSATSRTPIMPFTASATATSARTQVAPVTASSSATSARTPIMPLTVSNSATSAGTQVAPMTASTSATSTRAPIMPFTASANNTTPAQIQVMPFYTNANTPIPSQAPFYFSAPTMHPTHIQAMPFYASTTMNPTNIQTTPFYASTMTRIPTHIQGMPYGNANTTQTNTMPSSAGTSSAMTPTQILIARNNPMGFLASQSQVLRPTALHPGSAGSTASTISAVPAINVPPGTTDAMPQLRL